MTNLRKLKEERASHVQEMTSLVETAEKEKRAFADNEQARFDELDQLKTQLDGRIGNLDKINDMQTRAANSNSDLKKEMAGYNLQRSIQAQITGTPLDGLELEVHQELTRNMGREARGIFVPLEALNVEKRVALTSTTAGNLVSTDFKGDQFIDPLRNAAQTLNMGVTTLAGLTGPVDIPRQTGSLTTNWIAEDASTTASDLTFDKVSMAPNTISCMTSFSRRTMLQTNPGIENIIRRDIAAQMALGLDLAILDGDGINKPTGILQDTNVATVALGTNGANLTWANILDIISSVDDSNALQGNPGFMTTKQTVKKLRSTVKVASTDSRMIMESIDKLAGFNLTTTNQMPSTLTKGTGSALSALIFGNWSDLVVGYWSAVDILVNPYHTSVYDKGGVMVNAFLDVDAALRQDASFVKVTDIKTV